MCSMTDMQNNYYLFDNHKIDQSSSNEIFDRILTKIQHDLSSGFLYTHSRITYNTKKTLEASSFLYALIELLSEKGLITIDEIDMRKKDVAERLVKKFEESRIGLLYQEPEDDKYSFKKGAEIDCFNWLNTCKAVCCRIPFALSRQDVEEGIIRWEFGRPYLIAHDADGYCVHLDRKSYRCAVYDNRPVPCRGFDCRDNEKWPVWHDLNAMILNPAFNGKIEESNRKLYNY